MFLAGRVLYTVKKHFVLIQYSKMYMLIAISQHIYVFSLRFHPPFVITCWKVDYFHIRTLFPQCWDSVPKSSTHSAFTNSLFRKCRKWFSKGVRGALRTEVIMSKQRIFFPETIFQVSQQLSGAIMAEKTEQWRKQRTQEPDSKQRCVWQLHYVPHEELASISYSAVWVCIIVFLQTTSPLP